MLLLSANLKTASRNEVRNLHNTVCSFINDIFPEGPESLRLRALRAYTRDRIPVQNDASFNSSLNEFVNSDTQAGKLPEAVLASLGIKLLRNE